MGREIKTKINRLVSQWPKGTVSVTPHLDKIGYNSSLVWKYKQSGWLESFGSSAYILSGDRIEWPGALYALQTQLKLNIHAGGKTALELKGYAHYLSTRQSKIFLYAPQTEVLPSWFKGCRFGAKIVLVRTNLFPTKEKKGFTDYPARDFSIRISSPERAALEMLHLVPKDIGFDEAQLLMENLVSLRPEIVQSLLESCRSIKVKRLFLYLAEKHNHAWLSRLDLSRVNLGAGKRMVVESGRYDPKYRITVPRDHEEASA